MHSLTYGCERAITRPRQITLWAIVAGVWTAFAALSISQSAVSAWLVGLGPAEDPKIVVAVMLEFGVSGTNAARIASAIIGRYLGVASG